MTQLSRQIEVYLITGKKRTFASALDWPGWSRSGGDEISSLQSLLDYGLRYEQVANLARIEFPTPTDVSAFKVVERVQGGVTADFGAPGVASSRDAVPVDDAELSRLQALLDACWQAFATAAHAARGKELRKGPRGGGRELDGIIQHVLESSASYLARLNWKYKVGEVSDLNKDINRIRQANMDALASAAHGEVLEKGPRGGMRWTPRYFARYAAWHLLDHAWEIEDRII